MRSETVVKLPLLSVLVLSPIKTLLSAMVLSPIKHNVPNGAVICYPLIVVRRCILPTSKLGVSSMVPTFPDHQIFLTFPVFFSIFQYFTKIYLRNTLQLNKIKRKFFFKNSQNSPTYSVFWVKFPNFSNLFKIS